MGSSFACEHKNARVGALATFFHISPSFPFGFGPLACVFLCAVFMSTGSRVHKVHRGNGSLTVDRISEGGVVFFLGVVILACQP